MPHVSIDGPVRPPYVNVAFQQEEIELGREGVFAAAAGCSVAMSHVNTSLCFFFFPFFLM